jgi:hypothetical protein
MRRWRTAGFCDRCASPPCGRSPRLIPCSTRGVRGGAAVGHRGGAAEVHAFDVKSNAVGPCGDCSGGRRAGGGLPRDVVDGTRVGRVPVVPDDERLAPVVAACAACAESGTLAWAGRRCRVRVSASWLWTARARGWPRGRRLCTAVRPTSWCLGVRRHQGGRRPHALGSAGRSRRVAALPSRRFRHRSSSTRLPSPTMERNPGTPGPVRVRPWAVHSFPPVDGPGPDNRPQAANRSNVDVRRGPDSTSSSGSTASIA